MISESKPILLGSEINIIIHELGGRLAFLLAKVMDQFSEQTFHARVYPTGEIVVCHLSNEIYPNRTAVLVGDLVLLQYKANKPENKIYH